MFVCFFVINTGRNKKKKKTYGGSNLEGVPVLDLGSTLLRAVIGKLNVTSVQNSSDGLEHVLLLGLGHANVVHGLDQDREHGLVVDPVDLGAGRQDLELLGGRELPLGLPRVGGTAGELVEHVVVALVGVLQDNTRLLEQVVGDRRAVEDGVDVKVDLFNFLFFVF